MRQRDELKQEALFEATIKLVNEIGFVSSSVSKIAKEANVSPATLYVYYENKEDLLVSTYIRIKQNMSRAALKKFDKAQPIRDLLKTVWKGMFHYISKHPGQFRFAEQFASSPFNSLVDHAEVEQLFQPLLQAIQQGIESKQIKPVSLELLVAFYYYPITVLSNPRLSPDFKATTTQINTAFDMAWDAIKV